MTKDYRSARKRRVRTTMLSVTILVGTLGGVASSRAAETCGSLSEGHNDVSETPGCFTLAVPVGVDMLWLSMGRTGASWSASMSAYLADEHHLLCYFSDSDRHFVCAIPGPSNGPLHFGIHNTKGVTWSLEIQFREAQPVLGAATGYLYEPQDGAMFRFDALRDASVSAASFSDLNLRVRIGSPPTRDVADCVSQASPPRPFNVGKVRGDLAAELEQCHLDAVTGPVFAFVTFTRRTRVVADLPNLCLPSCTLPVSIWPPTVPFGGPKPCTDVCDQTFIISAR